MAESPLREKNQIDMSSSYRSRAARLPCNLKANFFLPALVYIEMARFVVCTYNSWKDSTLSIAATTAALVRLIPLSESGLVRFRLVERDLGHTTENGGCRGRCPTDTPITSSYIYTMGQNELN
jgi:hypothetical protein